MPRLREEVAGRWSRRRQLRGEREIRIALERTYAAVRPVGPAFSPLDKELGLLPGALTPTLQGHLSRLGTRLSFGEAASELGHLKGVWVATSSARRRTEGDGAIMRCSREPRGTGSGHGAASPTGTTGAAGQCGRGDGAVAGRVVAGGAHVGHRHGSAGARVGHGALRRPVVRLALGRRGHLHRPGRWRGAPRAGVERAGRVAGWSTAPTGAKASWTPTARTRCASSTSRMPPSV